MEELFGHKIIQAAYWVAAEIHTDTRALMFTSIIKIGGNVNCDHDMIICFQKKKKKKQHAKNIQ